MSPVNLHDVTGAHVKAYNSLADPTQITTKVTAMEASGSSITVPLQPHSLTALVCTEGLGADHVETDGGRRECCQQQDNAKQADESGNGRRIFADRVMGELLAHRSRANGSDKGLASSMACRLPLFLREWTN